MPEVKKEELTLRDRIYFCSEFGEFINSNLNNDLNQFCHIPKIGIGYPDFTPADLTALHSRFATNRIAATKVEIGEYQLIIDLFLYYICAILSLLYLCS